MAVLTDAALRSQISAALADNTSGDITPADLRDMFVDLLDTIESWYAVTTVSSSPPSGGNDGDVWYQIG